MNFAKLIIDVNIDINLFDKKIINDINIVINIILINSFKMNFANFVF